MPALQGADRQCQTACAAGVGMYLTNGVFLYRVVGVVAGGAEEIVDLEDCYRMDVGRIPISDLRARGLRVVTPSPESLPRRRDAGRDPEQAELRRTETVEGYERQRFLRSFRPFSCGGLCCCAAAVARFPPAPSTERE